MRRLAVQIAIVILVGAGLAAQPARVASADPPEPAQTVASFDVLAVSAGDHQTCAIRSDGTLACWPPGWAASPPAGTFTAVSAGTQYACAIGSDGTLTCWGANGSGEASPPAGTFTALSAGGHHACAIRTDGTLACWGWNDYGQATPPAGTFTAVSAGAGHTCAIRTDGTLACWGSDWHGQAPPPAGTFSAVGAGGYHACAIRSDGTLACWGWNEYGQATPPAGLFTAVSGGERHSCAIRADGTIACWGANGSGQATPPAGSYAAVSAGADHTCALPTAGKLACWGGFASWVPGPQVALAALPTWLATNAVVLRWSGTPFLAPVVSYDVRYRRARWDGGFGPYVTWLSATAATSATFTAWSGYTYCFQVRARDASGFIGPPSAETCTAIPLDDRSLSRSWSWVAGTGSTYYRSTYLRSSTLGATLIRTGVKATRIALLATTCSTCGSVKVYWGSTLLRTVSLYSKTTVNKKLITVATFTSGRSGTLSIKVSSSGKKVLIDGVAIRRN